MHRAQRQCLTRRHGEIQNFYFGSARSQSDGTDPEPILFPSRAGEGLCPVGCFGLFVDVLFFAKYTVAIPRFALVWLSR